MKKENSIALFNQIERRRHWDEENEIWYFSVIDVVSALTNQAEYKKAQSYLLDYLEK